MVKSYQSWEVGLQSAHPGGRRKGLAGQRDGSGNIKLSASVPNQI